MATTNSISFFMGPKHHNEKWTLPLSPFVSSQTNIANLVPKNTLFSLLAVTMYLPSNATSQKATLASILKRTKNMLHSLIIVSLTRFCFDDDAKGCDRWMLSDWLDFDIFCSEVASRQSSAKSRLSAFKVCTSFPALVKFCSMDTIGLIYVWTQLDGISFELRVWIKKVRIYNWHAPFK